MKIETECVRGFNSLEHQTGAISTPIFQTATFKHPGIGCSTGYDYSRTKNPTRENLEKTIAGLEKGDAGFAFSTGMAAISAVMGLFSPGDHIIVSDDLYGGTFRLFNEILQKNGLHFSYIDTQQINSVSDSIQENTRAIFIETPSNPMMKVTDIQAIVKLAKSYRLLVIVDNTFLTPLYQKPLELGADIVVHSATKFLGGHNDTLAGLVVTKDPYNSEKIGFIQNATGAVLSPFDSWLIIRGIKTLSIRMERQQENALTLARWLKTHPLIDQVYYIGLTDHPDHAITLQQSTGFGAMISFSVKDINWIEKILNNIRIISYAESLGGVESLLTYPLLQTHQAIPDEMKKKIGLNDRLLRFSVGLENSDDLINDLIQAMR